MANKLAPEIEIALKAYFDSIDTNKNGLVDKNELTKALRAANLNVTPRIAERMIQICEHNAAGEIGFNEFARLSLTLEQIKQIFQTVDEDRNGRINDTELGRGLLDLGFNFNRQIFTLIMKVVDVDQSGTVEFEEFIDLSLFLTAITQSFNRLSNKENATVNLDALIQIFSACGVRLPREAVSQAASTQNSFNFNSVVVIVFGLLDNLRNTSRH
eukprot:TRINITY_DN180_c0_g1_i1.p1 TRINITY_DN180_c0_g1~~TRINITY_DN180_c0_g1_i1.p1  ORF type:complete len:214 (-),score=114.37 TRINITY_DN180_c0_g1_i1:135-776(-)